MTRRTILIFSADTNLCFSLALLFQDRYRVVTTTNISAIEEIAAGSRADLAIVDESPSECLLKRLEKLGDGSATIPVIMLYVYNARDGALDVEFRSRAASVYYKPFEISHLSKRIDELLAA
ncbi:MAG TPA: hypothetical protein VML00_12550 [Bacteroidota bacterium]|nr:hypothetical protein [Bacteroidota bacterium]